MNKTKLLTWTSAVILTLLFTTSLAFGQAYGGQATAVRATVNAAGQPLVTTAVADTGSLSGAGGTISHSSVGVTVPGVLSVGSSTASITGASNSTVAQAGVNNLNIAAAGITVAASAVTSTAQVSCPGSVRTGSSVITGLTLNGTTVPVSGTPDESVTVFFGGTPIGTLVINEQVRIPGSMTVNALHLTITDPFDASLIDVVVGSSRAAINCAEPPPFNFISGRATGVHLTQSTLLTGVVSTIISDTGPLSTGGGSLSAATAGAGLSPILTTGVVTASSSGGAPGGTPDSTQSASTVTNAALNVGGPLGVSLSFDSIVSNSQCTAVSGTVTCSGSSSIANLQVTALGFPIGITINGLPNQEIILPAGLGRIVLNEQLGTFSGSPAHITVNAIRVELTIPGVAATTVVFASSHSGMQAGAGSTAADASISGRVTDANGRPMGKMNVAVVASDGSVRTVFTSAFGYFNFEGLQAGESYLVTVLGKRHRFESRFVNLGDSVTGVDFTAID